MSDLPEENVYARIGEEGFTRLVAAFYQQIPRDDILGKMYPAQDLAGAEKRLRDFLIFRFGGPKTYIVERGHPRLRMRHAPFVIDEAARDRWIALMNNAFAEVNFPPEVETKLRTLFEEWATFMRNAE